MEFKSSGNSGGCSSRAKLLIVIELTRWISGGPFRRWPMGKGRGRVKNSLSSRLPRSLVGRADVRKSILKLIEAYRVINDEMTKRAPLSPPSPWIRCAIHTDFDLSHSLESLMRSRKDGWTVFESRVLCANKMKWSVHNNCDDRSIGQFS